jgi:hypothetical protein
MALVVTGLSQDGDVGPLHKALVDAGLSTESLQVIGPDDSTESLSHGLIGADIITSDGGMGVPGITNSRRPTTFFRNETISDRLGDLEIPDSEIENYVEALERGKYVFAYFAHADNVEAIEAVFKNAALANVRRF